MAGEDQTVKVQDLGNDQVEMMVEKGFGGSERLVVRLISNRKDMQKDAKDIYDKVMTPRADSFATEVSNYQLKMNGVNKVLDDEELLKAGRDEEAKKGKKNGGQ